MLTYQFDKEDQDPNPQAQNNRINSSHHLFKHLQYHEAAAIILNIELTFQMKSPQCSSFWEVGTKHQLATIAAATQKVSSGITAAISIHYHYRD